MFKILRKLAGKSGPSAADEAAAAQKVAEEAAALAVANAQTSTQEIEGNTPVEFEEGKTATISELIESHKTVLSNVDNSSPLSPEDEIEVDGKKVTVHALMDCYRNAIKNAAEKEEEEKKKKELAENAKAKKPAVLRVKPFDRIANASALAAAKAVSESATNVPDNQEARLKRGVERYGKPYSRN